MSEAFEVHMVRFQTRTLHFSVAAYLLATSLGFGGLTLCIRNDGQLFLKHTWAQSLGCKSHRASCHGSDAASTARPCPATNRACEAEHSCFKVPLLMIATCRVCGQAVWPGNYAGHSACLRQGACLAVGISSAQLVPPGSGSLNFAVASLQSTILLM
jgi:hypothetical protein